MGSAVARRRAERERLLSVAREWVLELADRLPGLRAAVVVGSVARGDFNLWSDLDVLIVAEGLPSGWLARCDTLSPVPPGVQPIAWTLAELADRQRRGDPMVVEAASEGVLLWGALPAGVEGPTLRPQASQEIGPR